MEAHLIDHDGNTIMEPHNVALCDLIVEECCEVGVARSKMRRAGPDYVPFNNPADPPYIPGRPSYIEDFLTEIGDVYTLTMELVDRGFLTPADLREMRQTKLDKLRVRAPEIFKD